MKDLSVKIESVNNEILIFDLRNMFKIMNIQFFLYWYVSKLFIKNLFFIRKIKHDIKIKFSLLSVKTNSISFD